MPAEAMRPLLLPAHRALPEDTTPHEAVRVDPGDTVIDTKGVRWFNDSDYPSVEIDAAYVIPLPGNIMKPHQLTGFQRAIAAARRDQGQRPVFRMPMAAVSPVDLTDVAESQVAAHQNRLDELGLVAPWSSGDAYVDEYLRDPQGYLDTHWDEVDHDEVRARSVLRAEMDNLAKQLLRDNFGDLGKRKARLSDGHHRGFAAILAGEPTIWVRAEKLYSMPGLKPVERLADPRTTGARTENPQQWPLAGAEVDGLRVREHVPNTDSIASSLYEYQVLPGIREVAMASIPFTAPRDLFYAINDLDRVDWLASRIEASGEIAPLIVVVDAEGPYVLEGAHRLGALHVLERRAFPALVVLDLEDAAPMPGAPMTLFGRPQ